MIAELEEADDGTVIKANHCLVRYLPQNPEFAPEETVLEAGGFGQPHGGKRRNHRGGMPKAC